MQRRFLFALLLAYVAPVSALSCEELFARADRDQRSAVVIPSAGCDLSTILQVARHRLTISGEDSAATIRLVTPSAGLRIVNARNVTVRDLAIISAEQGGSTGDSIAVTGDSAGFTLERVRFRGGGAHIHLAGAHDFLISDTYHTGPRRNGMVIYCGHCSRGLIQRPVIEGYVVPPGGPFRAIDIVESDHIAVVEPTIRDIDATAQPNFLGIEFVDSQNGSVTGGHISGLINGDGIFVGRSNGITISRVTVTNNSGHPRVIPGGGSGSGIDVFGSGDVTIVACTVRHNGHSPSPASRHHALEIYQSDGVRIIDTVAEDSGKNGVLLYGSRRVLLVGVTAADNQESGLNAFKASARADVSGDQLTVPPGYSFGKQWRRGTPIRIGNEIHRIASVADNEHLTLTERLPAKKSQPWSVESSFIAVDSRFERNGRASHGSGYQDGLTVTDRTQAIIVGAPPAANGGTQKNGLKVYSDAQVFSLP